MLRPLLAISAIALTAAPAAASNYSAKLSVPTSDRFIARDIVWSWQTSPAGLQPWGLRHTPTWLGGVMSQVTGVPDPRFGERIVALVEPHPGAAPDEAELRDHVKGQLAIYKAPRHVLVVDSVARAPNGKLDYKAVKERALAAFGRASGEIQGVA